MTPELIVLIATAASIGFLHTLLGPDHYLPFIVMAKARGWSKAKALTITSLCGLGHVAGSMALGAVGIIFGLTVGSLETIEAVRGDWAAWALIAFGMTYLAWGLKKAFKDRPHVHVHTHGDGDVHKHKHNHHGSHAHVHTATAKVSLTPWALFIIFVLGPCEPLIPILMYPAAQQSWMGVIGVAAIFGTATLITMTTVVAIALFGLKQLSFAPVARFSHALAGGAVAASGGAIVFLGL
ncbi:MAG: sulfite exporter TauE/SafE family protein [Rhodospirillaceae bacterium]